MRILAFFAALMCIVGLSGCLGDHRGSIDQSDNDPVLRMATTVAERVVAASPKPIINVPPAEKVDVEELKNSINVSSEKTANQMSGLLNTNISKLTDQIKGVEANIGKLAEINNQMTANLTNRIDSEIRASAEFKADLKASIQSNIELRAQLQAQLTAVVQVQNEMKADLKAIANVSAKLEAQGAAIAGVGNAVSQMQQEINNKAGRDVNYFPKEAMYVIICILLVMLVLLSVIGYFIYKNSQVMIQNLYALLMRVVNITKAAKERPVVVSASELSRDLSGSHTIWDPLTVETRGGPNMVVKPSIFEGDSIDKVLSDAEKIMGDKK